MTQPAPSPAAPPVGVTELVLSGWHEPVTPISLGAITAGALATARAVKLLGWAVRETTGVAAAALSIYTGAGDSGELVVPINLAASESSRDWLGDPGIYCPKGLYVAIEAGSVTVVVWVRICEVGD